MANKAKMQQRIARQEARITVLEDNVFDLITSPAVHVTKITLSNEMLSLLRSLGVIPEKPVPQRPTVKQPQPQQQESVPVS